MANALTVEVAVVGGGPAGLTAAIALAEAGVTTALIARRPADDHRTTALLSSSVTALDTLGVWQGSAAQQTAELVPEGVAVVAAFHNLGSELLNAEGPVDCDVIVCSDDPHASEVVRRAPYFRIIGLPRIVKNAQAITAMTIMRFPKV